MDFFLAICLFLLIGFLYTTYSRPKYPPGKCYYLLLVLKKVSYSYLLNVFYLLPAICLIKHLIETYLVLVSVKE